MTLSEDPELSRVGSDALFPSRFGPLSLGGQPSREL
jgi:hypothetical protein